MVKPATPKKTMIIMRTTPSPGELCCVWLKITTLAPRTAATITAAAPRYLSVVRVEYDGL